jgi:tRNA threonylcarbamoyladenosine biosynthesis protein TsaB
VASDGSVGRLRRLPTAELAGRLVMPDGFRHWSALPASSVEHVPYDVPGMLAATAGHDLFHPAPEPDAYLHEEPSYATWTPQAHQAPPAP